jgi:hypothetical protein
MLKWREASSFSGIGAEHIPLYDNDEFHLVINYIKGYESAGAGWITGYFFIGVSCKNPCYGHLFIRQMDRITTAEEAVKWVWEFTGFPHASVKELQKVIDTNGNPPGLQKIERECEECERNES